jgi:large subunit ribosomal protein L13
MAKIIYDGTDAVLGRLSTMVAKDLLKGDSVDVINCEEIIVSGDKRKFAEKIMAKRDMGRGASLKGPKYSRVADRLVKRMIRGMLPRDTARGREAFKKLKCYIGAGGLKEDEVKTARRVEFQKPMKYSKIKEIVELIS